ncbi:SDR family oxidoreductase [Croceicoccus sp. F390]|uniref:SDR family oxidoreductase n=1 Tax=Croceicoccus esteveae TaxID=3075597 RepID=A0ABU2ZH01_9SPHN|nr:SDR family oxidoreductase [Croceicoccus sp. F390]MDT0575877.1 SDR family oxidoreductase [Croceicoccus sp. F390]
MGNKGMTVAHRQDIHFDFSGKKVLVTGGTSGLGAGIANAFANSGAHVTITGTRAQAADYDADLDRFDYRQLDVEDNASIDALADGIPALDVLVNNAGNSFFAAGLDEHDPDVFARAVQVHLNAPFRLVQRLADQLADSTQSGGGAVIGIGSVTSFMGMAVTLGYGAGKTGLLGMTRGLAVDLGPRNIRVNVVAAGVTRSRMTANVFAEKAWSEPTLARTPLGRMGEPEDIAGPVLFLASSAASWITGTTIMVDGGYTVSG